MLYKKIITLAIIALSTNLLSACGGSHYASMSEFQEPSQIQAEIAFISEKSSTLPPYGYVQFCQNNPAECSEKYAHTQYNSGLNNEVTASTARPMGVQPLNPFNLSYNLQRLISNSPEERENFDTVLSLLDSVNREVNNSVIQVTDMDGFGVVENWRIPNLNSVLADIGDCEDFALAKRKVLSERYGFNRDYLSVSVLRRPQGDIHAVLMVRTPYGDFVLDNLERDILPWHKTGYAWLKKQSFNQPSEWVSL